MAPSVDISVVVPVHDEERNLPPLHAEISAALSGMRRSWEVVYVDDASRDGSLGVLKDLWRRDPQVRVIEFAANAGQTAAMAAGFEHARGRLVVTIDGDLQNDPADIPAMVATLESGFDVVAGWRKSRQDGFVLRRLPSIVANRLIAWVTGVPIHDTGCTLKVFRREVIARLPIYAEQHRFLPAMSAASGARVCEVVVNHRARRFGRSKYGIGRARRVIFDLFTIKLLSGFSRRPLQYFMLLGLPFLIGATVHFLVIATGVASAHLHLTYFLLCTMACVYFFLLGLLAELAVRASDLFHSVEARTPLTERLGD